MAERTVLTTGCSMGTGCHTAFTLQARGWNVVARLRSPENETEIEALDSVLVPRLDAKHPGSIAASIEQAIDQSKGVPT